MGTNVKELLLEMAGEIPGKKNYQGFVKLMGRMGVEVRLNEMREDADLRFGGSGSWHPATEEMLLSLWDVAADGWAFYETKNHGDDDSSGSYTEAEYTQSKWFEYIGAFATRNKHHPVREWLFGLPAWDGISRIDDLLGSLFAIDYDRVPIEVVRTVSASILVNLVRRVLDPGCVAHNLPMLVGGQGIGKSTFVKHLAPTLDWFTDSLAMGLDGKEILEQTQGIWVVEKGELAGMSKADLNKVKQQISAETDRGRPAYARKLEKGELAGMSKADLNKVKQQISAETDRGRPAYARKLRKVPRQWFGIATVNPDDGVIPFDGSGERRWWLIPLERQSGPGGVIERMTADREQLFAEALSIVQNGGERLRNIIIPPQKVVDDMASIAKAHTYVDHTYDPIALWCLENTPAGTKYRMVDLATGFTIHRQKELDEVVNGKPSATSLTSETDRKYIPLKDPDALMAGYKGRQFAQSLRKAGWRDSNSASNGASLWWHD